MIIISELSGALQALTIQTAEEAERRAVYCEHLRQQIIWPLEKHLKEHQQSKDQNKEEMNRINRAKQSQYDLVGKYRERYYTRCKETAVISDTIAMGPATLANAIGSNHTVAGEPEQRKLKKAREAEAAADADFKQHMYRLIEINSQWVQRMSASAREFQVIELARLQLSQQVLTEHTEGLLRLNSTNCIVSEMIVAFGSPFIHFDREWKGCVNAPWSVIRSASWKGSCASTRRAPRFPVLFGLC